MGNAEYMGRLIVGLFSVWRDTSTASSHIRIGPRASFQQAKYRFSYLVSTCWVEGVNIQCAARLIVGLFSVWRDTSTASSPRPAGFLSAGQVQVRPRLLLVRRALRHVQRVACVIISDSLRDRSEA